MSVDAELDALAGENIALQTILVGLCEGLQRAGLGAAVENAFAYADNILEIGALKLGAAPRPGHMSKAFEVVEALRKATLGDHHKPQEGV